MRVISDSLHSRIKGADLTHDREAQLLSHYFAQGQTEEFIVVRDQRGALEFCFHGHLGWSTSVEW